MLPDVIEFEAGNLLMWAVYVGVVVTSMLNKTRLENIKKSRRKEHPWA